MNHSLNKNRVIATIAMLTGVPLTGAGVDIYVSSLPHITKYFHTGSTIVQLSLTIYILSYGIGQLFFGTLSDSWGRKWVLRGGALSFCVCSILAAISPNICFLLVMRFLQGVAVAAIGSVTRALPADLYKGDAAKRMMIYYTIAWACGPVLSPVIGGYLQHYFNWRAPFLFLAIYSGVFFFWTLIFSETHLQHHALSIKNTAKNFKAILTHPIFWGWIVLPACMYAVILIFGIIAPFLVQHEMGYSAVTYGHIAFLIGVAWLAGNLIARMLSGKDLSRVAIILFGSSISASVVVILLALLLPMTVVSLVVPVLIFILPASTLFALSYGGAMTPFTHIAGTASSAVGGIFAMSAGVMTSLATMLKAQTQVPMVSSFLVLMILSLLSYFFLVHRRK